MEILNDMNESCPFCEIKNCREIIFESESCLAFYDSFPVSQGHTLIIPKRHVESFFDLDKKEIDEIQELLHKVKQFLDEKFRPHGYNIGVNVGRSAGQSIFHVHVHLIPRYQGDVANPKGGVRGVIPAKQNY